MFYTNTKYEIEAKRIISESDQMITSISSVKDRGRIESELKFTLVLKSTGNIELYFDDIMKEFAHANSSPIFHSYFHNNFTKVGRNVEPDQVNRLLNCLSVPPVTKNENPQAFTSLKSLYNIRNDIAHGNINIMETYDDIKKYVSDSLVFLQLIINKLDSKTISK